MALSAWLQMEQLKKCLTLAVFPLVVHELPEGCLGHLQKDGDILVAKLKSLVNGWNFPLCEKVPNVHRNLSLRERINIGWLSTSTSWNFTSHTSSFTFYLFPHTLHRMHRNTTRLSSRFCQLISRNVRRVLLWKKAVQSCYTSFSNGQVSSHPASRSHGCFTKTDEDER